MELANINISCQKATFRESRKPYLTCYTYHLLSPDIKYVRLKCKTKF